MLLSETPEAHTASSCRPRTSMVSFLPVFCMPHRVKHISTTYHRGACEKSHFATGCASTGGSYVLLGSVTPRRAAPTLELTAAFVVVVVLLLVDVELTVAFVVVVVLLLVVELTVAFVVVVVVVVVVVRSFIPTNKQTNDERRRLRSF